MQKILADIEMLDGQTTTIRVIAVDRIALERHLRAQHIAVENAQITADIFTCWHAAKRTEFTSLDYANFLEQVADARTRTSDGEELATDVEDLAHPPA